MDDKAFVKIEDRKMPVDNFKYLPLDEEKNYSRGVVNFIFLTGIVITSFMWILLIFFRK
jgi:hypothetical protein